MLHKGLGPVGFEPCGNWPPRLFTSPQHKKGAEPQVGPGCGLGIGIHCEKRELAAKQANKIRPRVVILFILSVSLVNVLKPLARLNVLIFVQRRLWEG